MTHLPGKFVWFELVTKDAKRAQAFYGEVLGWKVEAAPMPGFTYEMIKVGDQTIGGYATPQGDQKTHWFSHVSVDNVDAVAKAAVAAGGRAVAPAMDVPEVGRMQRIADPLGAELSIFHSSRGDEPDAKGKDGTFFWNELLASDPAKAVGFYTKALGYTDKPTDFGGEIYHVLEQSGAPRAGIMKAPMGAPDHWLPYVQVADCDATLARAIKHGATQLAAPEDIPGIGRFAVFKDPVGGAIAVIKPSAQ